jgi:sensor histidine kinase YesM
MIRRSVWLPLGSAWIAVWASYALLMLVTSQASATRAITFSALATVVAAVASLGVWRVGGALPWPTRITLRFFGIHLLAALVFTSIWVVSGGVLEAVVFGESRALLGTRMFAARAVIGLFIYGSVAGISYAHQATERATRAEALAAEMKVAAIRRQLDPHFLFNALNSILALIPRDARAAGRAVEHLSSLLRGVLDERNDEVHLADEWDLVEQYLALERIRLGNRLRVDRHFQPETRRAVLPSFAIQSLIENSVRHAVSVRTEPTTIRVYASLDECALVVTVEDDGPGADLPSLEETGGLGLRAIRERLAVLYGGEGGISIRTSPGAGFAVILRIPQPEASRVREAS